MDKTSLTPQQKALRINFDSSVYGTFAEIGAGQEVARWFFQVGGAAGTVAKTISAYDMAVSDAIYGQTKRYVSRQRLEDMLAYEYGLLMERLALPRGEKSAFFVFADTVATRSFLRREDGNGWLGVRFQTAPRAEPSEIIIHVITRDTERAREQEALGIVGVNLLYGAVYQHEAPAGLIASLMDHLVRERIEINMIKFSGPAFATVDNRLMSLQLVERGFTDAAMFTAEGEVVQPAELLYKRPILVERGRFRPVTLLTLDLLERALAQFKSEPEHQSEQPVVLMEMTLHDLRSQATIDPQDFLARADLLRTLGQTVLISNHGPYYQLAEHLSRYTQKRIGIALGIPALQGIMDEQRYDDLPGRTLEALGRLFTHNVRVYLYPSLNPASGELITAETLLIAPNLRHLYAHLLQNRHVEPIRSYTPEYLSIDADRVLQQIQSGDTAWERLVPPAIVETIKNNRLFGWEAR
jgi:hypothetical protein